MAMTRRQADWKRRSTSRHCLSSQKQALQHLRQRSHQVYHVSSPEAQSELQYHIPGMHTVYSLRLQYTVPVCMVALWVNAEKLERCMN